MLNVAIAVVIVVVIIAVTWHYWAPPPLNTILCELVGLRIPLAPCGTYEFADEIFGEPAVVFAGPPGAPQLRITAYAFVDNHARTTADGWLSGAGYDARCFIDVHKLADDFYVIAVKSQAHAFPHAYAMLDNTSRPPLNNYYREISMAEFSDAVTARGVPVASLPIYKHLRAYRGITDCAKTQS